MVGELERHPPKWWGNGGEMVGKWWENYEHDREKWWKWWENATTCHQIWMGFLENHPLSPFLLCEISLLENQPHIFFAKHIPKNILETPETPQYSWRIIIAIPDSVRSVICFMLKHTSSRLSLGRKTTIFPGSTPPRSSSWRLHGVVHALSEEVQEATRLHPWHQWW